MCRQTIVRKQCDQFRRDASVEPPAVLVVNLRYEQGEGMQMQFVQLSAEHRTERAALRIDPSRDHRLRHSF
jgi:hypothetical protein